MLFSTLKIVQNFIFGAVKQKSQRKKRNLKNQLYDVTNERTQKLLLEALITDYLTHHVMLNVMEKVLSNMKFK